MPQGLICARLAKAAGAPVKLMLDRKEEHLATGNRPSAFATVKAGVAADGTLTAFDAQSWGTGGAGAGSGYPLPYIYVFPNRRRVHTDVYINAGLQRAMRAPGHPQGCFVTEVVMDELADAVRMDPVEFRLKNLPPLAPNAMWRRYFPMGAERIGWSKRHPTGDPTPGPIKRGLGCSANRWGGAGQGTRAHCEIHPDGSVLIRSGTQDIGTATRTLMAIITAETLGTHRRSGSRRARRQQSSVQRRQRRFDDGRVGVAGDSRDRRDGARSVVRAHRPRVEDDAGSTGAWASGDVKA